MTMKNLNKIELNYKTKVFKLADEFKISRVSKKFVKVVDIFLNCGATYGIGECVPYPRYNESLEDILEYLKKNKSKIEKIVENKNIQQIPFLCLQNALSSAVLDMELKNNKVGFLKLNQIKKSFTTSITIPIFNLKKTEKILKKFTKTKIIKIKLDQNEVIPKLSLIKRICPKSGIIIDANESWNKKFIEENIKTLENFNILLIEQPFPKGKDHYLKNIKSKLKFCADESFHLKNKNLKNSIKHYQCVNLKLDKFGTHKEILKHIHIAKNAKKKIMLGCMVSSSLSLYPALRYFKYCDYLDLDGAYFLKKDRSSGIVYKNGLAKLNFNFEWGKKKASQKRPFF